MKYLILIISLYQIGCVSNTMARYNREKAKCIKQTNSLNAEYECHNQFKDLLSFNELPFNDQVERCMERYQQTWEACSNFTMNWNSQRESERQQRIQGLSNAFNNYNSQISQPIVPRSQTCNSYRQYDGSYTTHCY